jgi:hypothetical protein
MAGTGCYVNSPPPNAEVPPPPPTPTSSPSASNAPTSEPAPRQDPSQHAQEVLDRANAVNALADKAVQLDGTDVTAQTANSIMYCRMQKDECVRLADGDAAKSKVGALAGLAAYFAHRVNPQMVDSWVLQREDEVALAEKAAKKAMQEAQKVATARAEQQSKMSFEDGDIEGAHRQCAAKPALCKDKCNSGDGASCVVWGMTLWDNKPPKLADARAVMVKGCNAGMQTACSYIPKIDADLQGVTAKANDLWNDVVEIGDDLAQKHHQAEMVRQIAATPRNLIALQRMQVITQAIVAEKYCPARKSFIEGASVVDFVKRATAHCKDEAPIGPGLSGAEVTLAAECREVYAAPCP